MSVEYRCERGSCATLTRWGAREIVARGGQVYAVWVDGRQRLYLSAQAARRIADSAGVEHVLDWETGDYADA